VLKGISGDLDGLHAKFYVWGTIFPTDDANTYEGTYHWDP
jgi:hypothetical protein